MPVAALLALIAAVLMHVAWNLAARTNSKNSFLWWALAAWLVLVGPWSLALLLQRAAWSGELVVLLAVTCTAEALYFLALGAAYRRAPVPLVYPIARSSPVLIALWTTLFFGERLSLAGWAGIGISVVGILMLAATARAGGIGRAVPLALLAAFATSVYSTSNKLAVPSLPDYGVQLGFVSVALLIAWLALTFDIRRSTGRWRPDAAASLGRAAFGGVCIGNAYALVIYAMQYIPAAYAVAFTNAGIVLAGVIAMTVYREREHWRARLGAMLVVCAGLALLAFAH